MCGKKTLKAKKVAAVKQIDTWLRNLVKQKRLQMLKFGDQSIQLSMKESFLKVRWRKVLDSSSMGSELNSERQMTFVNELIDREKSLDFFDKNVSKLHLSCQQFKRLPEQSFSNSISVLFNITKDTEYSKSFQFR